MVERWLCISMALILAGCATTPAATEAPGVPDLNGVWQVMNSANAVF